MARHPMSSSWPQLTARTSVSGQSSRLALQEDITVRTAQNTIFTDSPDGVRLPRRTRSTAPEPAACGQGSSPGFQAGVIRCRAVLLGFKHCSEIRI
jgi:hypothetical protein